MRARCNQCPDVPLKSSFKRAQRSDWRLSQQHRPIADELIVPSARAQSTDASGRLTVSSGLRSAATAHTAATSAAAIMRPAPSR